MNSHFLFHEKLTTNKAHDNHRQKEVSMPTVIITWSRFIHKILSSSHTNVHILSTKQGIWQTSCHYGSPLLWQFDEKRGYISYNISEKLYICTSLVSYLTAHTELKLICSLQPVYHVVTFCTIEYLTMGVSFNSKPCFCLQMEA